MGHARWGPAGQPLAGLSSPVASGRMLGALRRAALLGSQPTAPHLLRCMAVATGSSSSSSSSRKEYPDAPRVGIGVVILRKVDQQPQVLLIRRGEPPQKGCLCFPGGTLELGETMAACALREAREETGLLLRNEPPPGGALDTRSLACPRPVDAVDVLHRDDANRLLYHYVVVDLAAVPEDPTAVPVAADDADQVMWVPVRELPSLPDLVEHCARIAAEAVQRFDIPDR